MALLTQDPNRMKRGGAFLLAGSLAALWFTYEVRDRPNGIPFGLSMALTALVVGMLALRRAHRMKESPHPEGAAERQRKQNKYILVLLPFGWLGFGIYYGLAQGNTLAFLVSLIPAAFSAAVAVFFFRKQAVC